MCFARNPVHQGGSRMHGKASLRLAQRIAQVREIVSATEELGNDFDDERRDDQRSSDAETALLSSLRRIG